MNKLAILILMVFATLCYPEEASGRRAPATPKLPQTIQSLLQPFVAEYGKPDQRYSADVNFLPPGGVGLRVVEVGFKWTWKEKGRDMEEFYVLLTYDLSNILNPSKPDEGWILKYAGRVREQGW